jgi:hypothetical protein
MAGVLGGLAARRLGFYNGAVGLTNRGHPDREQPHGIIYAALFKLAGAATGPQIIYID